MLALVGVWLAWLGMDGWYGAFVVGVTFSLAWLNYAGKRPGLISDMVSMPQRTLIWYGALAMFGIGIDMIGRGALGLWFYTDPVTTGYALRIAAILYPFAMIAIVETYVLLRRALPTVAAVVMSWLLHVFGHELLNLRAEEWVYTLPWSEVMVLGIPATVIVGWGGLTAFAFLSRRYLRLPPVLE